MTVIMAAAAAATASAAVMPAAHGIFTNNSVVCVTCHRAHTATNEQLLMSDLGMCLTCHSGGTAADTDVGAGMYVNSPSDANNWGQVGGALLGGGFTNIHGTNPTTSKHDMDVTQSPFGSTTGAMVALTCTSCHTIHTSFAYAAQYRLLRTSVGDGVGPYAVNWNGPWTDASQTAQTTTITPDINMGYTEVDFSGGNPDLPIEYTRNYQSGLSAWCEGCHTVYGTPEGAAGSPDYIPYHRHKMDVQLVQGSRLYGTPSTDLPLNDLGPLGRTGADLMNCVTCHRAHGTDSTMTGVFLSAGRGGLPAMNTSMLLRRDNRGVCINCHAYLNDPSY
jgi:predicted CXXCH cytochrome family protein